MQESRLFKIVYHLLDKGRATASELAEKFEVSVRTIYRDIDALSGAGIPIYAEAGRNGGIYLMNDFVMDKAVLTEEEKREILTALHSINSTSNIDNSQILQKLSAIFNVGSESWLEVDFSRWGNNGTDNTKFELLKSAVIQQRCVKITYANSYGTISERIIQPLKVLYKSMSWYLKAYCTEKQDYRIFKLTRIITLEVLADTFDKKSFPELDEMSGQVYSTIVLRFAKEISYRVYDEFDNTQISTEENGDLMVTPTSDTTFDWYVNLNGTADVKATFTAEGRKKSCIIKLEEIEKISSLHRKENEDNAHLIKNPIVFAFLHRQPSRTSSNNRTI